MLGAILQPCSVSTRADRLDPEHFPVLVDEVDQYLRGRSSSAAKKAEADLRISLARRSSATLLLQLPDLSDLIAGLPGPGAAIDLRATDPLAQRLRRTDPQLRGDRADRLELTRVLVLGLDHQPYSALPQLNGYFNGRPMDLILQLMKSPDMPGWFTEGARRAGLTPAGFAAVAAVNTARDIDTANDITWREAIHELIAARTQIRRYATNVNQIAAALNAGVGAPPWTQHAITTTTTAVQRIDAATAGLLRRRP